MEDAITCEPFFHEAFRKIGLLTRISEEASADILSRFEKFQFEVYHQERAYEYAWVIHKKTSRSHEDYDDDYFKEGKKTSLYYEDSKSERCPISPSQPLS